MRVRNRLGVTDVVGELKTAKFVKFKAIWRFAAINKANDILVDVTVHNSFCTYEIDDFRHLADDVTSKTFGALLAEL